MTDKQLVEKAAYAVLEKKRLNWVIAMIAENSPARAWDIEVEVPQGPELIFSVPKGTEREMKDSISRQIEEELERLKVHRS
jgi:hypothetical protein